ncbi:DUF4831 family protein [Culturomica massiliensis]|uniref:DUF4831 family protein n=1 Tax=Culturomica massiliensis TaxID=1841857 RepID=UPI000839062D|nr:DUF4831 family protein [Culturomica massiliensis]
MRKIAFVLLLTAGIFFSVTAQKKKEITTPLTVSYCLPKVAYQVKVQLECTHQVPGPFWKNAERELGVKPDITVAGNYWRIVDIEMKPYYIPDENAMYAMTSSGDYNPVMLSLSPEGFIAGVAARSSASPVPDAVWSYVPFQEETEEVVDITSLNTYNPLKEVLDTNYTYQEIDGVMKKIWDPIVRYTTKSAEDNMSEAVKEIFRIRSERTRLLAAENSVPDGESLRIILKEFDRMEKDYLMLFMGKESVQRFEQTFTVVPEKAGETVVAFRFTEAAGIVPKRNVSAMAYGIRVDNVIVPSAPSDNTTVPASSAIYYRVPATATVSLMKVNEVLQSFPTVVPQLGVIKTIPTDVISNEGLSLEFYPQYGSLKSINKK